MLKRDCPNCNKELHYKNVVSFERQKIQNGWCKSCAHLKARNENKTNSIEKLLEDTNEAYYWIGFIFADGHISKKARLKIGLSIKELYHLKKFCSFIGVNKELIQIDDIKCTVSIMNTAVLNQLVKKFDFKERKTYNPPNLSLIFKDKTSEQIDSFIAGYIDGDGSIKNQYKRKDCGLSIKVHESWLENLRVMGLYIGESSKVKIANSGYAVLYNTNSQDLGPLKKRILNLDVPYMKRKWDIIDENFVSRYITSKIKREKIMQLLNQKTPRKEICKLLQVSESLISNVAKSNE